MRSPFEDVGHVYSVKEMASLALSRYSRVKVPKGSGRKRLEIARVDAVYQALAKAIDKNLRNMPDLDALHPFYAELFSTIMPRELYMTYRRRLKRVRAVLTRIWRSYRSSIASSTDRAEMARLRRECIGRMLSLIRRKARFVDEVKEALAKARRMPAIDVNGKMIIVAGMPQVGKSTLVKAVSSARTEIAHYPFTTKNIVVGHIPVNEDVIQIIDTPGLLDRPLSERNPIELRAVTALKHLKGVVVFLVDMSRTRMYTLEEQLNVLKDVIELFGGGKVIAAINKVDVSDARDLDEAVKALRERFNFERVYLISAKTGTGLGELLEEAFRALEVYKG